MELTDYKKLPGRIVARRAFYEVMDIGISDPGCFVVLEWRSHGLKESENTGIGTVSAVKRDEL